MVRLRSELSVAHARRTVELLVACLTLWPATITGGGASSAVGHVSEVGSPAPDDSIHFAVLPLPEQMRANATVTRLEAGKPVVVRQGSNGMVCTRIVPGEDAWDARCYDATMTRLIFRVQEILAEGVTTGPALRARVDAEARAGKLVLPARPSAGYRVLGPKDAYNPVTRRASPSLARWQSLHVPFATAAEMGLPDESAVSEADRRRMPYVMASGTWWAHVMIEH
jgi:hypothetical protein